MENKLPLDRFLKEIYTAAPPIEPPAEIQVSEPVESPDVWYDRLQGKKLEQIYNLPTGILKYIIEIESKGNPNVVSQRGARGLFQIMPAHISGFKGDPLNHQQAAQFVAKTLASLVKAFGNWPEALAAYNWGRGNVVRKGLKNAPEETLRYLNFFKNKGIKFHKLNPTIRDANTD